MDRSDLIACVFHFKKQKLLHLIKEKDVFDQFYGDVYIIKYQKRGLPYIHLLLFLYPNDQIFDVAKIDKIVFAELLTEKNYLTGQLLSIIFSVMLYGLYRN